MSASGSAPMVSGAVAYDELAARYDRIPVENRINGYMRRGSLARVLATVPPRARGLESARGGGGRGRGRGGGDPPRFSPWIRFSRGMRS